MEVFPRPLPGRGGGFLGGLTSPKLGAGPKKTQRLIPMHFKSVSRLKEEREALD